MVELMAASMKTCQEGAAIPVAPHRVLTVGQWNVLDPAVTTRFRRLALAGLFLVTVQLGTGAEVVMIVLDLAIGALACQAMRAVYIL